MSSILKLFPEFTAGSDLLESGGFSTHDQGLQDFVTEFGD